MPIAFLWDFFPKFLFPSWILGIRDSDQKIVNQVIKEHEAVIARMVNEQNLMQREYEGLLFSKENDYKEALAKLKLKVDQSKQEFQTKSHLYDLKMKELKVQLSKGFSVWLTDSFD